MEKDLPRRLAGQDNLFQASKTFMRTVGQASRIMPTGPIEDWIGLVRQLNRIAVADGGIDDGNLSIDGDQHFALRQKQHQAFKRIGIGVDEALERRPLRNLEL